MIVKPQANQSCKKRIPSEFQAWYRSPWARRWSTGTPGHWCSFGDNLGTGRLHPSLCTALHRELQGKGSSLEPGNVPSHHSLLQMLLPQSSPWKNQVYPILSLCWPHELSNHAINVGFALLLASQELGMSSFSHSPSVFPARTFPI